MSSTAKVMFSVKNKTIIGLKCSRLTSNMNKLVKNKTIIGLKFLYIKLKLS